jgi:uncharacterized protein YkwD
MKPKNKSYHIYFALFVLFILLFTPNIQKVSFAQESEGKPTGLGKAPQVDLQLLATQSEHTANTAQAVGKYKSYLPMATDPLAAKAFSSCAGTSEERKLATLAKVDPNQQRPVMNCHSILSNVAHARALDMARNGYFSHVNLDGYGPNFLVAQAGYRLPSWWPDTPSENYIESIAAGYPTADAAWTAWLNSSNHRVHVLGQNDFWAEQTNYGMGHVYIEGSPYGHYWVFISAPPEEN